MESEDKPLILVLCNHYLPGFRAGGGLRTIVNMVERLGDRYDFRIVTRCHDAGSPAKDFEEVEIDSWNSVGKAQVFYLQRKSVRISKLRELIKELKPDAIYTNSFFSTFTIYALKLRRLKLIPRIPIVLAPCGELTPGALDLKKRKKSLFLKAARLTDLYGGLVWKASTEIERKEIEKFAPREPLILSALDLPPKEILSGYRQSEKPLKEKGSARFVFLSRIDRKKNLDWLLDLIRERELPVFLEVYGPEEDSEYAASCRLKAAGLDSFGARVSFRGPLRYDLVPETFFGSHFFILPTLGENFGHVFIEALAAGTPLVIADTTPWRGLSDRGLGWDLSLSDRENWAGTIERCIEMDAEHYGRLSANCREFAVRWLADPKLEESNVAVLESALERRRENAGNCSADRAAR